MPEPIVATSAVSNMIEVFVSSCYHSSTSNRSTISQERCSNAELEGQCLQPHHATEKSGLRIAARLLRFSLISKESQAHDRNVTQSMHDDEV